MALVAESKIALPEDYDINEPPPEALEGSPLVVNTSLYLHSIMDVDEPGQTISLDMVLRMYWDDSRVEVRLPINDSLGYVLRTREPLKDLWFPDLYIDKVKEIRKPVFGNPSSYLRIFPGSRMLYSFRTNYDLSCPMDFTRYPVDVQDCYVAFESYGTSAAILDINWYQTVYKKDIVLNQYDFEIEFIKDKAVSQVGKAKFIHKSET